MYFSILYNNTLNAITGVCLWLQLLSHIPRNKVFSVSSSKTPSLSYWLSLSVLFQAFSCSLARPPCLLQPSPPATLSPSQCFIELVSTNTFNKTCLILSPPFPCPAWRSTAMWLGEEEWMTGQTSSLYQNNKKQRKTNTQWHTQLILNNTEKESSHLLVWGARNEHCKEFKVWGETKQ